MKLQSSLVMACAALLLTTAANAQVTFTDIGATAPTPGSLDISQLVTNTATGGVPGLNYYWDNGNGNATSTGFPGQTFTTSSATAGYVLTSLAIKTSGNGGGNSPATQFETQPFSLGIYQLSGTGLTNAELLYTFTASGALNIEGDWLKWSGLGLNLAPNTSYAYGFGIPPNPNPDDWELLGTATNITFPGGQVCEVVDAGGKVTYSTSTLTYEAAFDLGLSAPGAPVANVPVVSPTTASQGVVPGSDVILTAVPAGATPLSVQWQTDGGTGTTPTNIPTATSNVLVVNTTGWGPGTYTYDFTVANSSGSATSATVTIFVPVTSVTPAISVQFEGGANGYENLSPGLAAGYVPEQNWNIDGANTGDAATNVFVDYKGASTTLGVTVTFNAGHYGSADNVSTPDGILMSGGFWSGDGYTIAVTGVPYSSYDVYLYMLNDDNPNRRYGFTLGSQTFWGAVFDGNGYSVPPYTLDTEIAELPEDSQAQANLVKFANVSGGSYTIDGQTPDGNVALMGMQIVNTDAGAPVAGPIIVTSPTNTTIYAGLQLVLTENVTAGATPLTYQWLTDGGTGGPLAPIANATNSTLPVNTTPFASGNFDYAVIVNNSLGVSTSAVATVTVTASAPILVTDTTPNPVNEGYAGETVTFSTLIVGTLPITYQWFVNTGSGFTAISSASNPTAATDTLILTNVQAANAGTYYLSASNSVGGPLTTTPSALTVLADPTAPGAGTYGAALVTSEPLAYWQLNETGSTSSGVLPAYDYSGHELDGVYGEYAVDDITAQSSADGFPGFPAGTTALQTQTGGEDTYVSVPSLNFTSNSVTITMWIDATGNQAGYGGLFMSANATGLDTAGLGFSGSQNAAGEYALGYTWNSNSAATYGFDSGLFPPENQWSFVALVIEPADATLYLYYLDPVTSLPDLYSAVSAVTNGVETFNIDDGGTNAIGTHPYSEAGRAFGGNIDQVAVFDSALSQSQILAMFGKATGLTSFAPTITVQPTSVGVYSGGSATLSVSGINGTAPFTYQWQFNGANIADATNTTLALTDLTSANAGTYTLLVKNSVSTTTSSNAVVAVRTPVPGSYEAAVLKLNPLAYWSLDDTNGAPGTGLAFEYVSGLTGTYEAGAQYGVNGIEGPRPPAFPGFASNEWALETFYNQDNSYVGGMNTSLTATNLTFAMWINPQANVEAWAGLLMARNGPNTGDGFGFGGTANAAGMQELGYTWNQNSSDSWDFNTYLYPETNEWQFAAWVLEPSQSAIYLLSTNGVQVAVNAIPQDSEQFGLGLQIGNDTAGSDGGRTFPGMISGVAVFLSALSSNQVLSLYDAGIGAAPPPTGVAVSIAKATGGNVTLTWSAGTLVEATSLSGPWVTNTAAVSPFTLGATNTQMYFEVK